MSAARNTTAGGTETAIVVVRARAGWQLLNLRELWQYRELVGFLTWRDVKVRYKQTVLGAGWAVLQPAMMMVVFTIFLGRLANVSSGTLPYPLFVYAGLLPWFFFSSAITSAGNSVVGSERLITKIYFPRLAIPFAAVAAAVVDFFIAFSVLIAMMLWYGIPPGPAVLLVPLLVVVLGLAGLGIGALLAALNVAYRDFRYVIPFLVQLWMFATPTVYMKLGDDHGGVSSGLTYFLSLNPLVGIIAAFRAATLGGEIHWAQLAVSSASVMVILIFGCLYFRRVEDSFADII